MIPAALRRRADAAYRLEPLEGRYGQCLAAHDPALDWPPAPRTPSTYGMTPDERRCYAKRLMAKGWQAWEVRAVLVDPERVAA